MDEVQQLENQEQCQKELQTDFQDEIIVQNQEEKKSLPWHPQVGETFREYNAFERYLSLGPARSIAQIATALNLSKSAIYNYSKKWNWEERALLHDKVHYELRRNDALLESEQHRGMLRNLRSDVAQFSFIASNELAKLLKDFWSAYDNPLIMKKINFMFNISRTLEKTMGLAEIPLDEHALNDKSIRDININNMLNLNGDIEQISDEAYFAYKNHMKEVEDTRVPSPPENYMRRRDLVQVPSQPFPDLNKVLNDEDNEMDKLDIENSVQIV